MTDSVSGLASALQLEPAANATPDRPGGKVRHGGKHASAGSGHHHHGAAAGLLDVDLADGKPARPVDKASGKTHRRADGDGDVDQDDSFGWTIDALGSANVPTPTAATVSNPVANAIPAAVTPVIVKVAAPSPDSASRDPELPAGNRPIAAATGARGEATPPSQRWHATSAREPQNVTATDARRDVTSSRERWHETSPSEPQDATSPEQRAPASPRDDVDVPSPVSRSEGNAPVGRWDAISPGNWQVPLDATPARNADTGFTRSEAPAEPGPDIDLAKLLQGPVGASVGSERAIDTPSDATAGADVEPVLDTRYEIQGKQTHWAFYQSPSAPAVPASAPADFSLAKQSLQAMLGSVVSRGNIGRATAPSPVSNAASAIDESPDAAPPARSIKTASASLAAPLAVPVAERATSDSGAPSSEGGDYEPAPKNGAVPRMTKPAPAEPVTVTADQAIDTRSEPASPIAAPAQQVGKGIVAALADAPAASATPAPQLPTPDRPATPASVLRTLDLTLEPADLGSVRLKLSLRDNALAIDAQATKPSTAKLLDDDRQGLERSLRKDGYDISSLTITSISADTSAGANASLTGGSTYQDSSASASRFAGSQTGDQSRRDGATPEQQRERPGERQPQGSKRPGAQGAQGSGGLYV